MTTKDSKKAILLIKKGAISILALALFLSFAFAQLALTRTDTNRSDSVNDNARLPSTLSMEVLFLNYRTFAADLAWIQLVIDYGDQISKNRKNLYMLENGFVITGLDPSFKHVYSWVPGAFFANNLDPSVDEMKRLSTLLERGQNSFPYDGKISFDNALIYFGNSKNPSDARKYWEAGRGMYYTKEALKRPQTSDYAAFMLEYFKHQQASLLHKYTNMPNTYPWAKWMETRSRELDYQPNYDLLAKFLLTATDPDVVKKIREQLEEEKSGGSKAVITRVNALSRKFEIQHDGGWQSFVTPLLWSTLVVDNE